MKKREKMTQDIDQIEEFDPESSILFLGSGFSLGASNIANGSPPNGKELRRHFLQQLELPADTDYDLQVLREHLINAFGCAEMAA
jgi:hypothetical protein